MRAIGCFVLSALLLSSAGAADAAEWRLRFEDSGITEAESVTLQRLILDRPEVRRKLSGTRHRVVWTDFTSGVRLGQHSPFRMGVYNYSKARLLVIDGAFLPAGAPSSLVIHQAAETFEQPSPTQEEYEEAVRVVADDARFREAFRTRAVAPYRAMPAIIDPCGFECGPNQPRDRLLAIGLKPQNAAFKHEIVGVNLDSMTVQRYPEGAPPTSLAADPFCGYPDAGQSTTRRGTPGSTTLTAEQGGQTIWKMQVTRPSASSGAWGSAIDLTDVFYRGRKVLAQAHVPILNVQYENNACGPYRDWQYEENPFQAVGTDVTSGIRRATQKPKTIFESGSDQGNFAGVAAFTDGQELVLTTEFSAGWYRYLNEYRFHEDGTIRTRFGFSAVQNSCVCRTHVHHVYWRFDFDVASSAGNTAQELRLGRWQDVARETKYRRGGAISGWRVLDPVSRSGYQIVPGPGDGVADAYGKGDLWVLNYSASELDDSQVASGTEAYLDAFVNNEPVANRNLVVWYGAHFRHVPEANESTDHIVGPTLKPFARAAAVPE
jgi:hypothetical protein